MGSTSSDDEWQQTIKAADKIIESSEQQTSQNVWSPAVEDVLAKFAEKCACFRYMHYHCQLYYQRESMKFALPVIILSSFTGGLSLSLNSLIPEEQQKNASSGIGLVNLITGIIASVSQFLRPGPLSAEHKAASVQWGRLSRRIETTLAIPAELRSNDAQTFLKEACTEFDTLSEQSPHILKSVMKTFKEKFGEIKPADGLAQPDIADGVMRISIYGRENTSAATTPRRGNALFSALKKMGMGRRKPDSAVVVT